MKRLVLAGVLILSILYITVQPVYLSPVSGQSMEPTMESGDLIVYSQYIEPSHESVIVYKTADYLVSHRIVDVRESSDNVHLYQTKGDNNQIEDPYVVTDSQVKGTVIYSIDTPEFIDPQTDSQCSDVSGESPWFPIC